MNDDPTDSLVRCRVYFALQRAGIPLSVPAMTAFVESQDQERAKLHHERDIAQRLSALDLAQVELFREMNDDERRKLVERLRFAPFMKGELMTRQGAEAQWLYILTKGSARGDRLHRRGRTRSQLPSCTPATSSAKCRCSPANRAAHR